MRDERRDFLTKKHITDNKEIQKLLEVYIIFQTFLSIVL